MEFLQDYVGKYVIVRSVNEGVNAGVVTAIGVGAIALRNARRLHYHGPADKALAWYEGVALSGLASNSQVAAPVDKLICEDYSITLCSEVGQKSIEEFEVYASK